METFEKIFGSGARVRLMKLFLLNPEEVLSRKVAADRSKSTKTQTQRELRLLERLGFLKSKVVVEERGDRKIRVPGFVLSPEFPYAHAFRELFLSATVDRRALAKRLSRHGKVQLVITAGVFLDSPDSQVDLLVVGDDMKERGLRGAVGSIEADLGRQLRYAVLSTSDFKYRLGMCDRLVRDILDFPHDVVVDRQGIVVK